MKPPGPLPPTTTLTLPVTTSSGRETLHAEWFIGADSRRGAALIVHGYAEHCGRYREVANVLVGLGVAVLAFDLRGHGKSTGKRGYVERFADYEADVDVAYRALDERATAAGAGSRRLLVAHSNGGLITLPMLARRDRRLPVDAAVISSPFLALRLAVPAIKRGAARVLSRVWPTMAMANELKVEQLTSDPELQQARLVDTLCNDVATARWFTEAMTTQAAIEHDARGIAVPTLWTIGGDDPIADASVSARIAGTVPNAEIHVLAGYKHEVMNERQRGDVFELVRAFIERI
jgi:lysophospholipase